MNIRLNENNYSHNISRSGHEILCLRYLYIFCLLGKPYAVFENKEYGFKMTVLFN